MVRTYQRKTDRAERCNIEVLERVAERVISNKESLRKVAHEYNINFMTLHRYCKKKKSGEETAAGYRQPRLVFSPAQENLLVEYLLKASKIYYGLTHKELRRFAYQFAYSNKIKVPPNWTETESAGRDWFSNFIKRNPTLSQLTPEATSLSRGTSFNKHDVGFFFNNFADVLERYKFQCHEIYNLDETSVTTVQHSTRIIAGKGTKRVGANTSGESEKLVTLLVAVSASGNTIPPMFVFPRVNFRDHFIKAGPPGCIGAAHPSGCMTEKNFVVFMKHFVSVTKCTKEKPVLLLLDSHDSHVSLELVDYCRDNGVVLVIFPPHCSHKLQPLDVSVYGPFKRFFNATANSWMKKHPGKTMTIYDLPGIVAKSLPKATTRENIQKGFKVTGIFPFNRNVFGDEEFRPTNVTDCPEEHVQNPPEMGDEAREMGDDRPATAADPSLPQPADADRDCTKPTAEIPQDLPSPQLGTSPEHLIPDPVPTTSFDISGSLHASPPPTTNTGQEATGVIKIPEARRLFRKASPRKMQRGKSKKRLHTAILLPEKMKFQESLEKQSKTCQRNLDIIQFQKSDGNEKKRKVISDCWCLACGENWSHSSPGEKWVQCINCKDWAHEECIDGEDSLCHLCE